MRLYKCKKVYETDIKVEIFEITLLVTLKMIKSAMREN